MCNNKFKSQNFWLRLFAWFAFAAAVMVGLASCSKTIATASKQQSKVHEQTGSQTNTTTKTETETKVYGDTLAGKALLPVAEKADSTHINGTDSVVAESAGLKLTIRVKPKRNATGAVVGNQVDYTAIAKPKSTTNTHQVVLANVRTTAKKDSTGRQEATTKTKQGIGIPAWVYWLLAAIVAAVAVYFINPLKFLKRG